LSLTNTSLIRPQSSRALFSHAYASRIFLLFRFFFHSFPPYTDILPPRFACSLINLLKLDTLQPQTIKSTNGAIFFSSRQPCMPSPTDLSISSCCASFVFFLSLTTPPCPPRGPTLRRYTFSTHHTPLRLSFILSHRLSIDGLFKLIRNRTFQSARIRCVWMRLLITRSEGNAAVSTTFVSKARPCALIRVSNISRGSQSHEMLLDVR